MGELWKNINDVCFVRCPKVKKQFGEIDVGTFDIDNNTVQQWMHDHCKDCKSNKGNNATEGIYKAELVTMIYKLFNRIAKYQEKIKQYEKQIQQLKTELQGYQSNETEKEQTLKTQQLRDELESVRKELKRQHDKFDIAWKRKKEELKGVKAELEATKAELEHQKQGSNNNEKITEKEKATKKQGGEKKIRKSNTLEKCWKVFETERITGIRQSDNSIENKYNVNRKYVNTARARYNSICASVINGATAEKIHNEYRVSIVTSRRMVKEINKNTYEKL